MTGWRTVRALRYLARVIIAVAMVAGIWWFVSFMAGPQHVRWVLAVIVVALLVETNSGKR